MTTDERISLAGTTPWFARLRTRLFALCALAVLPVAISGIHHLYDERGERLAEAMARAEDFAKNGAAQHHDVIESARALLDTLSRIPVVRHGNADACEQLLASVAGNYPWQKGLWVVTPSGKVVCTTVTGGRGVDVADRPYFAKALATQSFVLSDVVVTKLRKEAAAIGALPILGPRDAVEAVMLVTIDLGWLSRIAAEVAQVVGGSVTLVDGKGTIIARHPHPDHWVGRDLSDHPFVREVLARAGGSFTAAGLERTHGIFGLAKLDGTEARLAVGFSEAEVLGKIDTYVRGGLVQLSIVIAATGLLVFLLSDRFFLRWMRALADSAALLGRGDLTTRAGLPAAAGEFAVLGRSLAVMAESLQRSQAAMRRDGEQLREGEARLRAMLDVATSGIVAIDARGTIQLFNPAAEKIFGYRADEVIGRNVIVLMPDAESAAHDGYLRHHLETGERRVIGIGREVRGRRKNGQVFPLELAVAPFAAGERRMFMGLLTDISERKAREQELHESRARLERQAADLAETAARLRESEANHRVLAETSADMIVRSTADGRRLYVSPASRRLLGYAPEELIDKQIDRLIHPDDLAAVRQAREEMWSKGASCTVTYRLKRQTGEYVWVEATFNPRYDDTSGMREVVALVRDVSERKRYEAELQARQQRLEIAWAEAERAKTERAGKSARAG